MKITLLLRNNEIIEYYTNQIIQTEQMPYMAIGYGFNGSSEATTENLDAYWSIVDQIFQELELDTTDYYTLLSIGLPVTFQFIAGGGGGSSGSDDTYGIRGSPGEILEKELSVQFGVPYIITVGAGGPGGYIPSNFGTIGSNSNVTTNTVIGGIGGTGYTNVPVTDFGPGPVNTGLGGSGGLINIDGCNGGSGVVIIKYNNQYPLASSTVGYPEYINDGMFHVYKFDNVGSITW